ncbi:hypothetical protein [uncultured Paraglaciecola sp.]|uniref:hypothetical protein n=1 Tax=uncultured Paraglaciecola sp. TaxID=1765024 RepID=UPI0030DB8BB8|tara:strand:+ start:56727 stop:57269 length:543 start_codon:yes stop_codon:yes gene_type:complete
MEYIIAWFFRVTNIRLIIIMCMVYLIFPLYLLPKIINTGSVGALDLLFWYNHDILYQMLTNYGEAIRNRYIIGLFTADLAYPFYYGTLLVMIFALVFKKLSIPFSRKLILIPYTVVLFDLTENSLLIFLLSTYPSQHLEIANLAGYITAIKWGASGVIATFIIYIVIFGIRSRKAIGHKP